MTDLFKNKFEKIYIDRLSLNSQIAERAMALYPENIEVIDGKPDLFSRGELTPAQYSRSKKNLFITPFAGVFFKRCPGAKKGLACCNYFVLNLGQQCDMDCSYCYLQSFINTPYMIIYSNIDVALKELEAIYSENKDKKVRIGTGEVIDSLSLDPLTLYSQKLIEFFRDKPNWNVEFKTKSSFVDQFINSEHSRNVIVSWSINPQYIIDQEEHLTASLSARLEAAKKCLSKKFQIAFHIDPVIWHTDWKENYKSLVDAVTEMFSPADMPYISLGALRLQSEQKDLMRERFGMKSWVNRAEMFTGAAGKMRYDQSLREEMFDFIIKEFKAKDPRWKIFLCMETPETWLKTTGELPYQQNPIKELFKPIHI